MNTAELLRKSAEMWRGLAKLQRGAYRRALNDTAAELAAWRG